MQTPPAVHTGAYMDATQHPQITANTNMPATVLYYNSIMTPHYKCSTTVSDASPCSGKALSDTECAALLRTLLCDHHEHARLADDTAEGASICTVPFLKALATTTQHPQTQTHASHTAVQILAQHSAMS